MPKETLHNLYDTVFKEFNIEKTDFEDWSLYKDRNKSEVIKNSKSALINESIRHGDMIYLLQSDVLKNLLNSTTITDEMFHKEEDEVDNLLAKQEGKIHRERDEQLYNL